MHIDSRDMKQINIMVKYSKNNREIQKLHKNTLFWDFFKFWYVRSEVGSQTDSTFNPISLRIYKNPLLKTMQMNKL